MPDDVYNPQPGDRDDTPTPAKPPGTQPKPEPRGPREVMLQRDDEAESYRELLAVLATPSDDDETDDTSVCAAVDLDSYINDFDDEDGEA